MKCPLRNYGYGAAFSRTYTGFFCASCGAENIFGEPREIVMMFVGHEVFKKSDDGRFISFHKIKPITGENDKLVCGFCGVVQELWTEECPDNVHEGV